MAISSVICWVLPPLSNSWIIITIWLYISLNRTPNIDCYWGGGRQYPSYLVRSMIAPERGLRGGFVNG